MPGSTTKHSQSAKTRRTKQSSTFSLWLVIVSLLVVGLAVALVMWNNRPAPPPVTSAVDIPTAWIQGKNLGNPEATVTVQVWEDFLCSHCREWTATVEPKLFNEYLKTGKARLEFHLLPLQGFAPGSTQAGLAAECAADQNLFWQYHDRLFEAQEEGQPGYTPPRLIEKAKTVGLDEEQFTQCLTSQQHQDKVNASLKAATDLGLNSTPSVLISGKRMAYPFDYPALKAEIDGLLTE